MTECLQYAPKYQQLLRDLKTTVEGLLVSQVANVWSIYGGLNRLHSSVDKIFRHGLIETSYLNFVQGLEWLQPETSKSYVSIDCEYKPHLPQHLKEDKAAIWLYKSLESHSVSQKLSWLLSDKTHLLNCYQPHAFLFHEQYAEATLICLKAVERNQANLMSEINPCLFLLQANARELHKLHRRCSSFPDNYVETPRKISDLQPHLELEVTNVMGKLKPWRSLPALKTSHLEVKHSVSKTTPSTPIHTKKIDKLPVKKKSSLKKPPQKKQVRHIIDNCDIIEHTPLSSSQSSGTVTDDFLGLSRSEVQSPRLVNRFLPLPGQKDFRRKPKKTFIEDGGMSVLPMATGYFPRPQKGQSLLSFLTSSQFARTNAALDRENAHFSISEAIISAVEQIKYKRNMKLIDDQDESDPEIVDLKQRIRLRRRVKLFEKHRRIWAESLLSDGKTDTTTSVSPCSTTPDTLSDSDSNVDDLEVNETSTLDDKKELSVSMASLFSEADVLQRPRGAPDGASDILSAEEVALSLISKFSEKHLPRASDLEWLVSEEDAPQALLPMPKSWPVSPDDSENQDIVTPLRGTNDWAPPRPQIIFTYHKAPSRKLLMTKQNYKCAGCSMKVAPQYASRFRYCDYLGRYFCTGCHTNQLALIPGRVLQKWDFTRYPVSTFSYRLLEQMYTDPLFRVFDLNSNIEKMSKNFQFCRRYRLGLHYLKDFVFTCRFAETVKETLEQEQSYIISEPDVYSMEDLVNVRSGDMKKRLQLLVELCCRHTSECPLCLARGFICEICKLEQVIFPWQMRRVARCSHCGACFHSKCWNQDRPCVKCARITKRRESLASLCDNQT